MNVRFGSGRLPALDRRKQEQQKQKGVDRNHPPRPSIAFHIVIPFVGSLDGGFSFDLSDGENMSPGHFFAVRAQKKLVIMLENKQDLSVCPGKCSLESYGHPLPGCCNNPNRQVSLNETVAYIIMAGEK